MKNIIIWICCIALLAGAGIGAYFLLTKNDVLKVNTSISFVKNDSAIFEISGEIKNAYDSDGEEIEKEFEFENITDSSKQISNFNIGDLFFKNDNGTIKDVIIEFQIKNHSDFPVFIEIEDINPQEIENISYSFSSSFFLAAANGTEIDSKTFEIRFTYSNEEIISAELTQNFKINISKFLGDGTESYPFLISSVSDWNRYFITGAADYAAEEYYFLQTKDLISGNYQIITEFNGFYDGGGFTINTTSSTALFGKVTGGWIKNLTADGTAVTMAYGVSYAAGIVSFVSNNATEVLIENCVNLRNNNCGTSYVGGIVGRASKVKIKNCANKGEISHTGTVETGGIAGGILSGIIINCVNMGDVKADLVFIGGIAGNINSTVVVANCYNTGKVTSTYTIGGTGGIVGYNLNGNILGCYSIGDISGNVNIGGIAGDNSGTVSSCYSISTEQITGKGTNAQDSFLLTLDEMKNETFMNELNDNLETIAALASLDISEFSEWAFTAGHTPYLVSLGVRL